MTQPKTENTKSDYMTTETHITNGELFRAVELIRGDISKVQKDVNALPTMRDIAYLEDRVKDLENWQTWAMRLGIPGLVTSIISFTSMVMTRT